MSDWLKLHRLSESRSTEAHQHLREGNRALAEASFKQAAEAEELALAQLEPGKPKTLGITAVSTVSLYYKAREFEKALFLAYRCLGNATLLGSAREQLDDLVQTLYSEREKERLSGQFMPGAVTVAVKGQNILRGAAPLELIVNTVKTLQAIFFRLIEMQKGKALRQHGGPTKDISQMFEPWLVQEAPGSFQFSVAVKVSSQLDMFSPENFEAGDIANKFLELVTTLANDETGELSKKIVPDADYRNAFRKLVRNLTPASDAFESITLSSKERPSAVAVLDEAKRPVLNQAIKSESLQADVKAGEIFEEFTGVLRALDLDKDWLKVDVTKTGKQAVVVGLAQALDDIIGPMVNKTVSVKVVKPKKGKLKFVDISLAE